MNKDDIKKKPDLVNKFQVGPGLGMVFMGLSYVWWWIMPWAWESYALDNRWAHNWAYAIIILTVGLAWYQKTPLSRLIAVIQSLMMPITASGAFNTLVCTFITLGIFLIWVILVLFERIGKKVYLVNKLEKRTFNWINLHSLVVAWILVGHMGLVFILARFPFELQFLNIEVILGVRPGYLEFFPPEGHDLATWTFDIALTIWMFLICYEQFKMGYNPNNKSWPRLSFWWTIFGLIGAPLVALAIQFA
jgi:hypothetical protein